MKNDVETKMDLIEARKDLQSIPIIVYEKAMDRAEREKKRLIYVIVLLIVLLVASNFAWIWYENQFVDVVTTTQEVEQESETGSNTFVGGDMIGQTDDKNNNE